MKDNSTASPPSDRPRASFGVRFENAISTGLLAAMVLLPLLEIAGRRLWRTGVPGSAALVQHATLWIAFFGGAIAARDGRHLSLGRLADRFSQPWRKGLSTFAAAVSAAVCLVLAYAGAVLVKADAADGHRIVPFLPVYLAEAVMPAGFALVAWRIVRAVPGGLGFRVGAGAGAAAGALFFASALPEGPLSFAMAFAAVAAAVALGAPLFVGLAGAAALLFRHAGVPLASIPAEIYRLVTSPTLPTIPLFAFAGYLLTVGGVSRRLVRFFRALVGWMPGAVAVVTVLVCTFFTTFTGASGVTIVALGGILLPALLEERYPERFSVGLLSASGSLGLLFPPCLPVILYAVMAGVPVDRMFRGGFLPGLLLSALMVIFAAFAGIRAGARRTPFSLRELGAAAWEAKWDLALPAIVLAGIFGGFATAVETAALTAIYSFLVGVAVQRDVGLRDDFPRAGLETARLVGGFLLILAAATGLSGYLVDAGVPQLVVEWVRGTIHSRLAFLLVLNAFLLAVGALMHIFSAIVVVVPILAPLAAAFGIHPVHMGVIFLANLELGFLMPPVGMNLFLSAYRFERPYAEVVQATLPFLLLLMAGVLIITYLPVLSTALLS